MNEFIKTFDNLYHAFQDFENKLNHFCFCVITLQNDPETIPELHKRNARIQNVIMYTRKILGTKIDEQTVNEVSSIFSKLLDEYKETIDRYRSVVPISKDVGNYDPVMDQIVDTFMESKIQAVQLLIDFNLKSPLQIFIPTKD